MREREHWKAIIRHALHGLSSVVVVGMVCNWVLLQADDPSPADALALVECEFFCQQLLVGSELLKLKWSHDALEVMPSLCVLHVLHEQCFLKHEV